MMTFKMVSLFTTSIAVDNSDAFRTRQGAYHSTFAFSPRYSARYLEVWHVDLFIPHKTIQRSSFSTRVAAPFLQLTGVCVCVRLWVRAFVCALFFAFDPIDLLGFCQVC